MTAGVDCPLAPTVVLPSPRRWNCKNRRGSQGLSREEPWLEIPRQPNSSPQSSGMARRAVSISPGTTATTGRAGPGRWTPLS
jgi:hypothetical protein